MEVVMMQQGGGLNVPSGLKRVGRKVSSYHSPDSHFESQATNVAFWEIEIEERVTVPCISTHWGCPARKGELEFIRIKDTWFSWDGDMIEPERIQDLQSGKLFVAYQQGMGSLHFRSADPKEFNERYHILWTSLRPEIVAAVKAHFARCNMHNG